MPLHGMGGLERSVRDLVCHLAARGVHVTLITPPASRVRREAATDPFASPLIQVRHVPYLTFPLANRRGTTVLDRSTAYLLFGWRAGRMARALVAAGAIDIVHGFGASVLGYARARASAGAPLVFNPQGLEEFGGTGRLSAPKRIGYWPLRRAVRRCARAADRVIATDASLEGTVTRHLRPRPGQMCTIPNGIDLVEAARFAGPAEGAILRQRHGIGPGETVLLSAGRLEHNKGLDVLADALGQASQSRSALAAAGWRWVIVGGGPFRKEIERAIGAHGIGRHVFFAGRAPDAELHAWYEAASIFVHPTRYEGSSLVTLEAMAHRKPVIATRAGGLPDKVHPGVNGWLVEPDDPAALAAAIEQAASNSAELVRMGVESRAIVEREFAWPVLAERYLTLYRELLDQPTSRT